MRKKGPCRPGASTLDRTGQIIPGSSSIRVEMNRAKAWLHANPRPSVQGVFLVTSVENKGFSTALILRLRSTIRFGHESAAEKP